MVRAEGSRPRGRGFESRRILDGCKRFASYYIKEKLKIKVAKWGTPKKYLKTKYLFKKLKTDCLKIASLNKDTSFVPLIQVSVIYREIIIM